MVFLFGRIPRVDDVLRDGCVPILNGPAVDNATPCPLPYSDGPSTLLAVSYSHLTIMSEHHYLDVDLARVVLTDHTLTEIHIHPHVRIDADGVCDALKARRLLLPDDAGPILIVAVGNPAWDTAALRVDMFGNDAHTISALGVLLEDRVLATAATMYFTLFPAKFPVKVDSNEPKLRQWLLKDQLRLNPTN